MQNQSHLKKKISVIVFISGISILFISPVLLSIAPSNLIESPQASLTTTLDYNSYVYSFYFADDADIISWSFQSSNIIVGIKVYAMDSDQFEYFQNSMSFDYYELSSGSYKSDYSTFRPPYSELWYIVFLNQDSDIESTSLTYSTSIEYNAYLPTGWEDFDFVILIIIAVLVAILLVDVAILIWINKDAKTRGMDSGMWVVIVLFLGIIGLIIYLIIREPKKSANTKIEPKLNQPFSYSQTNNIPSVNINNKIETIVCDMCGQESRPNAQFCEYCGNKLR